MTNQDISDRLRRRAAELARDGDNLYRVRAFRQAAMAVLTLTEPVAAVLAAQGRDGLERLPGVGRSLAGTIASFAGGGPPPAAPPAPSGGREWNVARRGGAAARPLRVAAAAGSGYAPRPSPRRAAGCRPCFDPPVASPPSA